MPDAGDDPRASNVVPMNARDGRLSRWFERVGELAMRRQVAMAAVFLLMIGVGLIFYQSHPRPTDAQDDRVPDVVPAVEVTASPGNAPTAAGNPARLAGPATAHASEHEDRYRAYANPTAPASAGAHADPSVQRERVQAMQQAQAGRAGAGSANLEMQANNGAGLDSLGASGSQGAVANAPSTIRTPTVMPMPSPAAAPMHAATQVPQSAPSAIPSAPAARQAMTDQAPPANTAQAVRPSNETIVRLQSELASASDEASRARIRAQLIAAYESSAMYAEANALRAQTAEPAAAASNSISNTAGTPNSMAELQQNPGLAAGSNGGSVTASPMAGSSSQSSTTRTRSRRTTSVHRAAPARSAPSDAYMDSAY